MDIQTLQKLLTAVQTGETSVSQALEELKNFPYENLGFARVDHHRALRSGFPEVVFCPGKETEQIIQIMLRLASSGSNIIATRAKPEVFTQVQRQLPSAEYFPEGQLILLRQKPIATWGAVLVVSAGTADIPIAEEAALVAEIMGCSVQRLYDVGVAGLHRILDAREQLYAAQVIIVVAGMEGALASVVAGLVDKPVIAVPTSIGYGANFGGLAPLLTMLNSCAPGIGVVNIDNGYGAAALAAAIVRQSHTDRT